MGTKTGNTRSDSKPTNLTQSEIESSSASDATISADQETPRRLDSTAVGIWILALLGIVYTLYFAKVIIVPITLALILNLVLSPMVRRIRRVTRVPEVVSAALIIVGGVFIFIAALVLLAGPASDWIEQAPSQFREIEAKFRPVSDSFDQINEASRKLTDAASKADEFAPTVVLSKPTVTSQILDTTGGVMVGVTITLGLLFFLLAGGDQFLEKIVHAMPTLKEKRRAVELTRHVQRSVSHYLSTITYINFGLGVVIGTGLWLIGIPNAPLWGAMAMGLNFIPLIGAMVGASIVFFVGLVTFDTVGQAALAPIIYVTANVIEANVITPALIGRRMSLSPVMVVLSLTVWTWLWGVTGAILAVPILAVLKIVAENFERTQTLAGFLGGARQPLPIENPPADTSTATTPVATPASPGS